MPIRVVFDPHRAAHRDRRLDLLLRHRVRSIGRYGAWTDSGTDDAIIAGRQAAAISIIGDAPAAKAPRPGDR